MAITLYTGTPGAGKTLRSIYDALELKAKTSRPVYHIGIDGMNDEFIPKAPIDSIEDWRKLPPGSVLIVDEAHKFFPVRQPGKPPEWIQAITEIRHFGIDLWLVSQDPRNLDAFVRRLIGKHYHLTRKAGLNGAMVREFEGVSEDPNDYHNRQGTTQTPWKYPKHLFQVYKSATLHVVKPKIPKKILFAGVLLLACVIAIPTMLWNFGSTVDGLDEKKQAGGTSASSSSASKAAFAPASGSSERTSPWTSAEEFAKAHTPLIPNVPWSAPVFADLKPTTTPDILCIAAGLPGAKDRTCHCYTEQATRIHNVPNSVCESYAQNGSYNPYRPRSTPPAQQAASGARVDGDDAPTNVVIPIKKENGA